AEDTEGNKKESERFGVAAKGEFGMPKPFLERRYAMFSIPFLADQPEISLLLRGLKYKEEWRLYRWEGEGYVEYPNVSGAEPGTAFWLAVKEPIQVKATGTTINPAKAYRLSLRKGWNQIADPFAFPIKLGECYVEAESKRVPFLDAVDLVEPKAWIWQDETGDDLNNGRYLILDKPSSTLNPWEGCWVYAFSDVELVFAPGESSVGGAPGFAGWLVVIDLIAEDGADRGNLIGCAPGASDGHDRYDALEPPSPSPGVSLTFPHRDWGIHSGDYMADIRPEGVEGYIVWMVEVRCEPGEEAIIRWRGDVPEGRRLYLEDLSSGMRVEMGSRGEYRFRAEGSVSLFRVRLTGRDLPMEIEGFVPGETVLFQNYPNPFNPETWIPFGLSEDGRVVLEIWDLGGRLIRKFDLGELRAGLYLSRERAVRWDGRNELGERVASGVYVYTLRINGETLQRRMIVTR
nr:hypothetical protein [Candidatus Sigynarchaeota archaeon]